MGRTWRDDPVAQTQEALENLRVGEYALAQQQAFALVKGGAADSGRAWMIVAAAQQTRRDYAGAIGSYRSALASCNSANMREHAMRQIRACELAKTPVTVQAPSKALDNNRAELAKVEWLTATDNSEHFIVRSRNAKLTRIVAAEAETALKRICGVTLGGQDYPNLVDVFVWPNRAEYAARTGDATGVSGGSFRLGAKEGKITRRLDLTQLDDGGRFADIVLDRVLPHEMSHLVTREFFGDAYCPLFLNEGLAMCSESAPDSQRILLAGTALAGKGRIALEDLIPIQRQDLAEVSVFYAESYSFVSFLRSRLSESQFKDLLEQVKAGASFGEALNRALHICGDRDILPDVAEAWEKQAIDQAQELRILRGDKEAKFRPAPPVRE